MADNIDLYSTSRVRFTREEIDLLMAGGTTIKLKKGQVLYNSGEPCHMVYFLRKGKTKYHTVYPDGSSRNTAYAEAPDLLGVINILPDHLTLNCCTAVTACEVVACPSELFLERVEHYNLMSKLFRFSTETSRHIYQTLTTLLSENRVSLVNSLRNDLGLTLQETADFIGCSRVHVSRIIKQLDAVEDQSTTESIEP